ncbi:MAG: hydrolase, partial [Pedobacter sp.]
FYYGIGGIKTDQEDPGMQHFTIEPKAVADLSFCRTSYNSLYGKIRSEWKRDADGKFHILLEIPVNSSATFVLPSGKKSIKDESGNIVSVKEVNNKLQADFSSGIYKLEVN